MKNAPVMTELSRLLQVDKIPLGGIEEHIVASPTERKALAARFGLADIPRLEAFLNVDRAENNMLAVTGRIKADVVQACVITLEPIINKIEEPLDVLFAPQEQRVDDSPTIAWSDLDPPEPIRNGAIDLGELVAQHLGSALDPYPRKEGAIFQGLNIESGAGGAAPFAGLKKLFEKENKSDKTKK